MKKYKLLGVVYLLNVLLAFHYNLLLFINSSFLNQFFSQSQVSVLYIIGSSLTLLLLVNISKVIRKMGSYRLLTYLIGAEIIATIGMAFSNNPILIGLYFIIYQLAMPTIAFGFDLFLESVAPDENKTGEIRTTYLTFENLTIIICALLISWLAAANNFSRVYIVSVIFLVPLYIVLKRYFIHFADSPFPALRFRETVQKYLRDSDIYNVFASHLLLQIFYAFMTIYMPIYLSKYIGFSWSEIGLIFSIALLPFIIFEVPVGWLADKKWGEKEMMTIGLIIMGIFSLCVSFISVRNFLLWATILFFSRIGAAMLEATTDTYFFKKVDRDSTDIIGFYRIGRPLSYIVAPIIATLSLTFLAYHNLFLVLGILMICGCYYSLSLKDTR